MKQLTILLLILLPLLAIAQGGTTLDEYRYLSKGYVAQLEMGLDSNKKGYHVSELFTASNDARLVALFKNTQEEAKALLVIIEEKDQKPVYICIPNKDANERVMSLYNLDQKAISRIKVKDQYEKAMQEFLFASVNKRPSIQKEPMLSQEPVFPESFGNEKMLATKGEQSLDIVNPQRIEKPILAESPAPVKSKPAKQTISGGIAQREISFAPEVYVATLKKGVVAVKVCIDVDGYVTSAKFTQRGSTTFDRDLKKLAVDSAGKYRFSKSDVREQCGIITFQF